MRLALLALLLTASAHAQSCETYLFPHDVNIITTATVTAQRTPILQDSPDGDDPKSSHAYLIQGNAVLAAHARGSYRCVAYFNGKKQTTGWVAQSALASMVPPPFTDTWAGKWTRQSSGSGDAVITIRQKGSALEAEALATLALSRDNVRTGTAGGTLKFRNSITASFGQEGSDRANTCRVNIRILGDLLLADDGATDDSNSACGGMGVTFNGIYRRNAH
jgi:hypothetical protein